MKQTDLENTSDSSVWTKWKTEWPQMAKLVLESLLLVLPLATDHSTPTAMAQNLPCWALTFSQAPP